MKSSAAEKSQRIAAQYLEENFETDDRLAVVVLDRRSAAVTQRLARAGNVAAPDFQAWLRHKNAQHCEIYISMNTIRPGARTREKQDIALVRHVYLDLDQDGATTTKTLLGTEDMPWPNYVIESSPDKRQIVWRVEGFEKEEAEALQRRLVEELGADPAATDCSRVLRLPGFYNHKYATPHFVTAEQTATAVYRPEHFAAYLKRIGESAESRPRGAATTPRRTGRTDGISQSERDWAYAKRALARGDRPESVIDAIAQHRAGEKHDPQYYAEHTVKKAQEALQREVSSRESLEPPR